MTTIEVGPVVIGAGAIGLAIAAELSDKADVIVLEAENKFGQHTSSRNSEVIHSGIYYEPGSLKSTLCLSGKTMLYDYLEENNIPFSRSGKLIVAKQDEIHKLEHLIDRACKTGLDHAILDAEQLKKKCDIVSADAAIFIPETGYFDSHAFMQSLAVTIASNNGHIQYNAKVSDIVTDKRITVELVDGTRLKTDCLINSAGLKADILANKLGNSEKLTFYKGEYYITDKIKNLPHLIYSVPPDDQLSLGIHTRHYLDGRVGFGPNAYQCSGTDYSLNEDRKEEFIRDITKYLNIGLSKDNLRVDYCGIRPKIGTGKISSDFKIISQEFDNAKAISLLGIESPGLTCSLSLAKYVAGLAGY
jgi:L-2-hydroxyglutarate oxidase LhgO